MAMDIALLLLGLALAALTLRDVFETVVVPGGSRASLHIARRIVLVLLPLWKAVRGKRRGLSDTFAPLVLVLSFVVWMSLLTLGFGLMAYAARYHFDPPLRSFAESVYLAGSSLATVGLSRSIPIGWGRWIILGAGFCGLAVMTMAVTYLLEVQASIARRDTGILKLATSAGIPPSALTLLERFAAIGNSGELADVLREGRNWCATVRQSHGAHPSLIYFRTEGTGAGWPASLGALLDLALIAQHLIDDDALYGPAVLLREDAVRMATELAEMLELSPASDSGSEVDIGEVAVRLELAGYRLRPTIDVAEVARQRTEAQCPVEAIADHLGKPGAVLVRR